MKMTKLGEKHELEVIDIFNEDASLNLSDCIIKEKIVLCSRRNRKRTAEKGILVKTEIHTNQSWYLGENQSGY